MKAIEAAGDIALIGGTPIVDRDVFCLGQYMTIVKKII